MRKVTTPRLWVEPRSVVDFIVCCSPTMCDGTVYNYRCSVNVMRGNFYWISLLTLLFGIICTRDVLIHVLSVQPSLAVSLILARPVTYSWLAACPPQPPHSTCSAYQLPQFATIVSRVKLLMAMIEPLMAMVVSISGNCWCPSRQY